MSAAEKLAPAAPVAPPRGTSALDVLWQIARAPVRALNSAERALLNQIALRGAGLGECSPPVAELAASVGVVRSTAQATLSRLRSRGLVRVVLRARRSEAGIERLPSKLRIDPVALAALGQRSRLSVVETDTEETPKISEMPDTGQPRPVIGQPCPGSGQSKGIEKALEKEEEEEREGERASAPPTREGSSSESELPTLPADLPTHPALETDAQGPELPTAAPDPDPAPELEAPPSIEPPPASVEVEREVEATGPFTAEGSYLETFRAAWADKYGCPAPRRRDDLAEALTVLENAEAQTRAYCARCKARGETCGTYLWLLNDCLDHWTTTYLARPGRVTSDYPAGYLAGRRHPLSCLVHELDTLPTPWAAEEEQRQREAVAAKAAQARAEADARQREADAAKWAAHRPPSTPSPLTWVGRSIPANDAPSPRVAPVVRLPLPPAPRPAPSVDPYAMQAMQVRAALTPEEQATLATLEAIPANERTTEQSVRISRLLHAGMSRLEE